MNLILFNFESNLNSQALGFALDWVNEISKNTDKLYVISLKCGEYKIADNVEVHCIHQDKKNRIKTIFAIWKTLYQIHQKDKSIGGYFVHMAHYFVPIIYPFAKIFKQKIVLWYAHKSVPFSLKIANFLTDKAVASTALGYQINTKKLSIIGQGIDTEKFRLKDYFNDKIKNIVTVGRISKVKNTHLIVESFLKLGREDIYLYIIGSPLTREDYQYLDEIKKIIPKELEKNILFTGAIPFDQLPDFYENMDLAINLSDTGSLDKVIIEPMAMGIPVITSNESAKKLFNHLDNAGVYLINHSNELEDKLQSILSCNLPFDRQILREEIAKEHSLQELAKEIVAKFL